MNVDGVLNEHAVFLVLVNRFEKSLPNGPELLEKSKIVNNSVNIGARLPKVGSL